MKLINYLNESEFVSNLTKEKAFEILETKCKNNWEFTKKNSFGIIFRRWWFK